MGMNYIFFCVRDKDEHDMTEMATSLNTPWIQQPSSMHDQTSDVWSSVGHFFVEAFRAASLIHLIVRRKSLRKLQGLLIGKSLASLGVSA